MKIFINLLLGLCLGSFFNVIIMRFDSGQSFIKGRSKCDTCQKYIKWYDLIPVISYICLLGKCRYCKTKIPINHVYAEVIFGIGFLVASYLNLDIMKTTIMYITIIGIGISAISDFKSGTIYTLFCDIASVIVVIINLFLRNNICQYIQILIATLLIMFVIYLIDKERFLGAGDYHIIFLLIASVGIIDTCYCIFYGSIIGVTQYIVTGMKKKTLVFVPLLYYGYLISLMT